MESTGCLRYNDNCLVVRMAEWTIATVCKTVALTGYPGSNPGPDTTASSTSNVVKHKRGFAEIAQW